MKTTRELTCITCPMGCALTVELEENKVISVMGNTCKRGISYAEAECTNPTRMLTTTVKVCGSKAPLVCVKTAMPVPKPLLSQCMEELNKIKVNAPVKRGDVILSNILDTGIDILATSEA